MTWFFKLEGLLINCFRTDTYEVLHYPQWAAVKKKGDYSASKTLWHPDHTDNKGPQSNSIKLGLLSVLKDSSI